MNRGTEGKATMKCPECGKLIRTSESMLGGILAAWHKPPKASNAQTFLKGQCVFSGTVTHERRA